MACDLPAAAAAFYPSAPVNTVPARAAGGAPVARLLHVGALVSGRWMLGLCLLGLFTTACSAATTPRPPPDSQLVAAELRLGIERLAKLRLEQAVLGGQGRQESESRREVQRLRAALYSLRGDPNLSGRRREQLERVMRDLDPMLASFEPGAAPADLDELYRDSEALAARISFLSTGLTKDRVDSRAGAQVDLLTRSAAMALRLGKLNFVVARKGAVRTRTVAVDLQQTLIEFSSALSAIGGHAELDERMRSELSLVDHQWLLLRASLDDSGLVKHQLRLPDIASTTDRIAQTLFVMAQRAVPATPREPERRLKATDLMCALARRRPGVLARAPAARRPGWRFVAACGA